MTFLIVEGEGDNITLVPEEEGDVLFTNEMFKKFYPNNTAGKFRSPMPYLRILEEEDLIALVANHFTKGFYNIVKDETVKWYRTLDANVFELVGSGVVKPGYYPEPENLIMEIIGCMFQINFDLKVPYPVKSIPQLTINDDGFVVMTKTYFDGPDNKKYKMYIQVSPGIARLLGCANSGSCDTQYDQRRLQYHFPLLVPLSKPNMRPPYKYVYLYSSLTKTYLQKFKMCDLTYGFTEHVNPMFVTIEANYGDDDPIDFYFLDIDGNEVNKRGTTSIVVRFAHKGTVEVEKVNWPPSQITGPIPKLLSGESNRNQESSLCLKS